MELQALKNPGFGGAEAGGGGERCKGEATAKNRCWITRK